MSASLEYMKITGYEDNDFQNEVGSAYEMMINPDTLKWQKSIDYNSLQAADSSAPDLKYKSTPSATLGFDVVIDATGIVDSKRVDLATEVQNLENTVYAYQGKSHRPNFVKIQWGNIVFECVCKTFNTNYTLFKPDGTPLRAKITLSFTEYVSPSRRKKLEGKESPDITHSVQVKEGDSLPSLCNKTWGDPFLYVQVAEFNGLNKFRGLKSGELLIFPPIKKLPTT